MKEFIEPSDRLIPSDSKDANIDNAEAKQAAAQNQAMPIYEYNSQDALKVHDMIESPPEGVTYEQVMAMIALGTNDFKGRKREELIEFFGGDIQLNVEDAQKLFVEIRRKQSTKH